MSIKKLLILGVVLGLMAGKGFAQTQGTETVVGTETIEPALVLEYKSDEPIVDVIFDEAEMTVEEARDLGMKGLEQKKVTETVRVQYPKVLVTKKAVKFLDSKGNIERNIPLKEDNYERVIVSSQNEKVVIKGTTDKLEGGYRYLKLVSKKGEVKKMAEGGESFSSFMSGNGKYIVTGKQHMGIDNFNECTLYDIDGNKLWTQTIEYPYYWKVHILYDGKVVITEIVEEKGIRKGKLTLIDTNGEKVWKYDLISALDYDIFSTIDGKILIYARYYPGGGLKKHLYILYGFDEKGNLLWQPKEYKGFNNSFHKLAISKDANYLTGLTLWDYLWVMDINTGDVIWKYSLKGKKPDTLEISRNGEYILLGGKILDGKSGKLLTQIEGRGKFLGTDKIWRRKGNKIEIFNISDILKLKEEE